jgi:hypothetical protein
MKILHLILKFSNKFFFYNCFNYVCEVKYILILTALIFTSCGQDGGKLKYEFSYGHYAKQDKTGKYPYIMNVYDISENTLDIVSYNEKRKVKNVLETLSLKWTTTNKGVKVGYSESKSTAVVFHNNQFYFSNGVAASSIIIDLKAHNDFDNSLFLQMIIPNYDGGTDEVKNNGLLKLSEEEINQLKSSKNVSYNEVVKEITEGINN